MSKNIWSFECANCGIPGVDPGFLEMGFIYITGWGFALLVLSHFLKYPMKNGGQEGGSSKPPEPPLVPLLHSLVILALTL